MLQPKLVVLEGMIVFRERVDWHVEVELECGHRDVEKLVLLHSEEEPVVEVMPGTRLGLLQEELSVKLSVVGFWKMPSRVTSVNPGNTTVGDANLGRKLQSFTISSESSSACYSTRFTSQPPASVRYLYIRNCHTETKLGFSHAFRSPFIPRDARDILSYASSETDPAWLYPCLLPFHVAGFSNMGLRKAT